MNLDAIILDASLCMYCLKLRKSGRIVKYVVSGTRAAIAMDVIRAGDHPTNFEP